MTCQKHMSRQVTGSEMKIGMAREEKRDGLVVMYFVLSSVFWICILTSRCSYKNWGSNN